MLGEINKEDLKKIIDIIIENFKTKEEKINNLNVFPVPDGDTGTNMLLTLKSIKEEVLKSSSLSLENIFEKISFGALMGARGNSGVILSQILKGFFDVLTKSDNFDLETIKEALKSSREIAYDSVQNPTEGTMLTTIKDICNYVEQLSEKGNEVSMIDLINDIISETEKSVERTTFLLPVLKQANVVDAGAFGIYEILNGARKAFISIDNINGNMSKKINRENRKRAPKNLHEIDESKSPKKEINEDSETIIAEEASGRKLSSLEEVKMRSEIKYTYCTELVVKGNEMDVERLREKIESYGDSAMIVGNKNFIKIHVHTNHPHKVLNRAIREGTLHEIQINNMKDQRLEIIGEEILPEKEPEIQRAALVVVSNGEGLENVFKSLGVDIVISGGQSMNPSTYDIVKSINSLAAREVLIFPNNKNIILTANQARKIIKDKTVSIIPTRTITEGITAILNYNPDVTLEENIQNMEKSIKNAKSGEITQAVRDANLLVGQIKKGNFIGLFNGKVRVIGENIVDTTIDLIRDISNGNEEVITFYVGKEAKPEDTSKIKDKIKEIFPEMDVEMHRGDQPLYPYIFSTE